MFVLTTFALAILKLFFFALRPGRVSVHHSQFCPLETQKPLVSTFTVSPFHICLLTFSPGQHIIILSFLVPNHLFSWLMLLDTLPFASGSPKSMMSGQVPALERLGRDDANLRQAWTTQQDTPSKKWCPNCMLCICWPSISVNSYPSSYSEWSQIICGLCIITSYSCMTA